MGHNCGNCLFFSKLRSICRALPPKTQLAGVRQDGAPLMVTSWPTVTEAEWCGAHQSDLSTS